MSDIKLYCQAWKRAEGCQADEPCCWIRESEKDIGRWQFAWMRRWYSKCDAYFDNTTMAENIPTDPDRKFRYKFKCRKCSEKCNIRSNFDFSTTDLCAKTGQHIAKWVKVME